MRVAVQGGARAETEFRRLLRLVLVLLPALLRRPETRGRFERKHSTHGTAAAARTCAWVHQFFCPAMGRRKEGADNNLLQVCPWPRAPCERMGWGRAPLPLSILLVHHGVERRLLFLQTGRRPIGLIGWLLSFRGLQVRHDELRSAQHPLRRFSRCGPFTRTGHIPGGGAATFAGGWPD